MHDRSLLVQLATPAGIPSGWLTFDLFSGGKFPPAVKVNAAAFQGLVFEGMDRLVVWVEGEDLVVAVVHPYFDGVYHLAQGGPHLLGQTVEHSSQLPARFPSGNHVAINRIEALRMRSHRLRQRTALLQAHTDVTDCPAPSGVLDLAFKRRQRIG